MNKFTLLVLTLNEEEGMKQIMPQIDHSLFEQILIVDGGSKDGTVEYSKECGYEVYVQKNSGLKNAYVEVLDLIKGDAVICFSPDGNSIPEALPQLINKYNEGYEMVIASRYLDGAKSDDDDPITAFGNKMFTTLINFVYGTKYTDAMVMYRAIDKNVFSQLDLDINSSYWPEKMFFTDVCLMPLLSMRAGTSNMRVSEIPADEPKRIGGERKLQIIRWGSAYLTQLLTDKLWWKPKA